MQVTVKILRYNPEKDKKQHYETYPVEADPTDRVLDLLEKIKGYQDGTLAFRRSCAHGICGSCAMRINGRNRLACKTLVPWPCARSRLRSPASGGAHLPSRFRLHLPHDKP